MIPEITIAYRLNFYWGAKCSFTTEISAFIGVTDRSITQCMVRHYPRIVSCPHDYHSNYLPLHGFTQLVYSLLLANF